LVNRPLEMVMTDDLIFTSSRGSVYQFTKSGSFIRKVNKIGKGPNECFGRTFTVNPKNQNIYIYDNYKHDIKIFDFEGIFHKTIGEVNFQANFDETESLISYKNHLIFEKIGLKPIENFFYVKNLDCDSLVYSHKNHYNVELKKRVRMFESFGTYFQTYKDTLLFKEKFCDSLFYTSDFKTFQAKYIFKLPSNKLSYEEDIKMRALELPQEYDKKFRILRVIETNKYILFSIINNEKKYLSIYNKINNELKTQKGLVILNDYDNGVDFRTFGFESNISHADTIYSTIDPYELIESQKQHYENMIDNSNLLDLMKNITQNDNSIIMHVVL
ncbi:MAG: 6-bladed beta-propeller, partial [bacterium]